MVENNLYTAFQVMLTYLIQSKKKEYKDEVPDEAVRLAESFLDQTTEGKKYLKRYHSSIARWIINFVTERFVPGYGSFLVMRKKFVELKVDEFINKHDECQVINIGAGIDTLTTRLARRYPNNKFIELDYPSVAKFKSELCKDDNLSFVGCDLTEDSVSEILVNANASKQKPTIFILEGVLMYLEKDSAFRLIKTLSEIVEEESAILFSTMGEGEGEEILGRSAEKAMKRNNSELKWRMKKDELFSCISHSGFEIQEHRGHEEFITLFKGQLPRPKHIVKSEYFSFACSAR